MKSLFHGSARSVRAGVAMAAIAALATVVLAGCPAPEPEEPEPPRLSRAELVDTDEIQLRITNLPDADEFDRLEFSIDHDIEVVSAERRVPMVVLRTEGEFVEEETYTLTMYDPEFDVTSEMEIDLGMLVEARMNEMYTDKELGYIYEDGTSIFRLFVPRGEEVFVHIFDHPADEEGEVHEMEHIGEQVFEARVEEELWGKFYGYQITERSHDPQPIVPEVPMDTIFADPYSEAVASLNEYPQKHRTLIYDSDFDWEDVESPGHDINDLVIMESHVRDLSAHETAETPYPGTYRGIVEAERGGLAYLEDLGVNAVEFLPLHHFNNIEAPYDEHSYGFRNTWNPFEENYWGYMTTSFFAPETYYATDGHLERGEWIGTDGRAVDELKELVREMHRNDMAVLLDVVYNHTSQYDEQALKLIDYEYYYRQPDQTGTGTELESRRRMVRRMFADSVVHWMEEYKIDGFRFDLAASHDRETIEYITERAQEVNPNVYLIAEPWGGAGLTGAHDFIDIGWAKWDDGIRNAIRSENRPTGEGQNFALGNADNASQLQQYWEGDQQGEPYQYVGYIESHDDATFGDNLRIQSGYYSFLDEDGEINRIEDIAEYQELPEDLIRANKVGAGALFLSQGPIMLHLGQEWARGKVMPDLEGEVPEVTDQGQIGAASDNVVYRTPSPNTYMADNEVNWINFDHVELNRDLLEYYKGLIELRKEQPLLGRGGPETVETMTTGNPNALGADIDGEIYGFVNSDPHESASFQIPAGTYSVVVDGESAGTEELYEMEGGQIEVEPASTLILLPK